MTAAARCSAIETAKPISHHFERASGGSAGRSFQFADLGAAALAGASRRGTTENGGAAAIFASRRGTSGNGMTTALVFSSLRGFFAFLVAIRKRRGEAAVKDGKDGMESALGRR